MPAPGAARAPSTGPRPGRPAALVAVVVALCLEALALLGVAAVYLAGVLREGAQDPVPAYLTTALALALGAALLTAVRGLLRGRRWARAPAVTWQLLQTAVVLPALGGSFRGGAVGLLVLAAVVVGGLLAPSVVRATSGGGAPPVL